MIEMFCVNNLIPYYQNFEQILVNPEDVKTFVEDHWVDMMPEKFRDSMKKEVDSMFGREPEEEPQA